MVWEIVVAILACAKIWYDDKSINNEFCILGTEPFCYIEKNYIKIKSDNNNYFEDSYAFNIINKILTFPFRYFVFFKNALIKILDDNPNISKIINKIVINKKNKIIIQKIKPILIKILPFFSLFSNKLVANICFYIYIANSILILSNFINIFSSPNKIILFFIFQNILILFCFIFYNEQKNFFILFSNDENIIIFSIFLFSTLFSILFKIIFKKKILSLFSKVTLMFSNILLLLLKIK